MKTIQFPFQNSDAILTVYIQNTGEGCGRVTRRPLILILPGGAYTHCSLREADPVAFGYLNAGYNVAILEYSCLGEGGWPLPLEDYETAMNIIEDHTEEWNLFPDKRAVIGFSAGGHLALSGSLLTNQVPDALLLIYPVVTDYDQYDSTSINPIDYIHPGMPPVFQFSTYNDESVPVSNSLQLLNALHQSHCQFESHIVSEGKHGFATGDPWTQKDDAPMCDRVPEWMNLSIRWLTDQFGQWYK